MGNILIYVFACFVGAIVYLLMAKWIFDIPTIVKYQKMQYDHAKMQTWLLSKIAENNGITKVEIRSMKKSLIPDEYHDY